VIAILTLVAVALAWAVHRDVQKLLAAFQRTHDGYADPSAPAVVTAGATSSPALPSPGSTPAKARARALEEADAAEEARLGPLDAEVLDLARITLRVARSRTQGIHYPGGTVAVLPYTPEERVRVEALAARWGCDVPDTIARLLQIALDLDEDPPPPTSSLH
jgi:hypothetical protein